MKILIPVIILVGLFIGFGMPVPVVTQEAMAPSEELPTFAEVADELPDRNQQAALPSMAGAENPERRRLRRAVLRAAKALEADPCSKAQRQKFLAAARPFAESIRNGEPEIALVNGKEQDLSQRFDRPAADAIFSALLKGHIDAQDLGGPLARFLKGKKTSMAERHEKRCRG